MSKSLCLLLAGLIPLAPANLITAADTDAPVRDYSSWIEDMKSAERGPFSHLSWFCNDGVVLEPKPYACKEHGGGYQHGEWSDRTRALRDEGFLIANVLAGLDAKAAVDGPDFRNQYAQILVERFLLNADDGWIFRRARFYRGALQEEDERDAARNLLIEMASRPYWIGPGFPALRAGVQTLPHGGDSASIQRVRQLSASLSEQDEGFQPYRAKIHGAPEAADAESVRRYAQALQDASSRQPYLELADEIDRFYQPAPLIDILNGMAARHTTAPWLKELLLEAAGSLRQSASAGEQFIITGRLLADLRRSVSRIRSASERLDILDLSLSTERQHFKAATELCVVVASTPRRRLVKHLESAMLAAFGTGLINARLLGEAQKTLGSMAVDSVPLDRYLSNLSYLGRAPGWGTQTLRMHFFEPMEKLAQIEPMAMLFIQDQLRGSPLLFYSRVLDGMMRDANRLAGVMHRLFGEDIGVGFKALNPGLGQGILHVELDSSETERYTFEGIYVLPETVSDLPPVAGILTAGEGNPLSHVQLLARNLGIPNVTIDDSIVARLLEHEGERVVLAVSPSGLVELSHWGEQWRGIFGHADTGNAILINPDLEKLDLTAREPVSLDELRANDSGRIVGPKAAKLGELRTHYPGQVSRGVAIPFGAFRQEALGQPHPDGGSVFDWMVRKYRELDSIPADSPQHGELAETMRAELYDIIFNTQTSPEFKTTLRAALKDSFGTEDPPGMFVRSDTNVEDLGGFTGAGLNLTLPNVVGFDNLLKSIAEVWASPFTTRAIAWRQSHMTQPEHVYASVLLLESVASDKSGVLVTQDIDTGDRGIVSIAVNEGLGGAVDGQAAESLRVSLNGSYLRVLGTATAPWRKVPDPNGGLRHLPSSGSDTVLFPEEIEQIIDFARHLPERFPPIINGEGRPAPADVEFGFLGGELRLFQLRPFLESMKARRIDILQQMENRLQDTEVLAVNMNKAPES